MFAGFVGGRDTLAHESVFGVDFPPIAASVDASASCSGSITPYAGHIGDRECGASAAVCVL